MKPTDSDYTLSLILTSHCIISIDIKSNNVSNMNSSDTYEKSVYNFELFIGPVQIQKYFTLVFDLYILDQN